MENKPWFNHYSKSAGLSAPTIAPLPGRKNAYAHVSPRIDCYQQKKSVGGATPAPVESQPSAASKQKQQFNSTDVKPDNLLLSTNDAQSVLPKLDSVVLADCDDDINSTAANSYSAAASSFISSDIDQPVQPLTAANDHHWNEWNETIDTVPTAVPFEYQYDAAYDDQQQSISSNNKITSTTDKNADCKGKKESSAAPPKQAMKTSQQYEDELKSLIIRAKESRAKKNFSMACALIEEFEVLAISSPALMDRPAWKLRRSYIDCLKAECLTLNIGSRGWFSRVTEAHLLVTNVLSDCSSKRMHQFATHIKLACDFFIKANRSEDVDFYDVGTLIETFMGELFDLYIKMVDFENKTIEEKPWEIVLNEWNPNWFDPHRSASSHHQNEHLFPSLHAMGILCDTRFAAVEDQLIYTRVFRCLGLGLDSPWNEVVRAFRKLSLVLHEDKNTPDMSEEEKAERKRQYLIIDEAKNKIRERLLGDEDDGSSSYDSETADDNKFDFDEAYQKPKFKLSPKIATDEPIKPLPGKKKAFPHVSYRVDCYRDKQVMASFEDNMNKCNSIINHRRDHKCNPLLAIYDR